MKYTLVEPKNYKDLYKAHEFNLELYKYHAKLYNNARLFPDNYGDIDAMLDNDRFMEEGGKILIFKTDKISVGYVRLKFEKNTVIINEFIITKEYRGQGLGYKLYQELYKEVLSKYKKIEASVSSNNTPTIKFWEDIGFKIKSKNKLFYRLEMEVK